VAARMKTFTYQLSNLKYVEEGYTLRGPVDFEISSDDDSENEEQILVPRNLSSTAIKVIKRNTVTIDMIYFIIVNRNPKNH
jgi:hypothetical protein